MVASILGRKLGQTQVYVTAEDVGNFQFLNPKTDVGRAIPVTVIEAGPCPILQVKTKEKDGYTALQLGFGKKKVKRTTKPLLGHFKKAGADPAQFVREVLWDGSGEPKVGEKVTVEVLKGAKTVDVIGLTKGRGFSGVVRRWGFHGGPATHGQSDRERAPGSLGRQHSISQGVYPGKKMGGHYGHERVTMQNLRVIRTDAEKNILLVHGGVPGPVGAFVIINQSEAYNAELEAKRAMGQVKKKK
ncbi:MAG: 50S ribosomal protein L3 [Planctomycetes bacterium]|nr:50S ribosomal protein L3 [Planctomycetota bacterium]